MRRRIRRNFLAFHIHQDETGCVPYLVCKVSVRFYTLHVETHVVAGRIAGDQRQAQCVRTVFVDDFQRIDTVSEGFAHLASLRVSYKPVEQYSFEGFFAHLLISGENHTDNPEENDIVTGYKHVSRIEIFQLLCLFRPAKSGEGPQRGRKPGIQRIGILCKMCAAALRTNSRLGARYHGFAAGIAVISRNSVSPPQLSGNTPVFDVVRPVEVGLFHAFRNQTDFLLLNCFYCGLDQLVHLYKPLLFDHRLDGRAAAVMGAYIMAVVFDPD